MTTAMQAAMVVAAAEGRRQTMAVAGSGAAKFAAREVVRGALFEIGAQSIRWLLSQFGVDWDPTGTDPYPPGGGEGSGDGKCWKIAADSNEGLFSAKYGSDVGVFGSGYEILEWHWRVNPDGTVQPFIADVLVRTEPDGDPWWIGPSFGAETITAVWIEPLGGSRCEATGPDSGPILPDPVQVVEGDCTFTVQFRSFITDGNGNALGDLVEIQGEGTALGPDDPLSPCTISPTIIYSPVVGEPEFIPPDGPDGTPRSIEEIIEEINNTERKIIEEINNNTDERIEEYFNERVPVIAGGTWDLQGVCEKDAEGAILDPQPTTEWTYQGGSAAVVANYQLMLMQEMLQQQLDWRHLTCGGSKPELQGDWVSTGWMSLEASENSNRPLRKLFRYRSLGDRDVVALLGYWKDFQWEAGPVCVVHTKAWWGLLQVWAASEEEGKRVIRFAGVNAGIDPDTEGTWQISTSTGSRYGRTGTMTLACYKGQYHVSARDTPDWPTMQPGEIYES